MENKDNTKQVRLRVLTPIRVVFDKLIDFVILRSSEGDMGVLYGHEPYMALLDYGTLRIFVDREEHEELLMITGGIAEVRGNEVTVLSDFAEYPNLMGDQNER